MNIKGRYAVECIGADGCPKWREELDNAIMVEGKNVFLDAALAGSSYTVNGPFIGLISAASYTAGPSATDTMLSHTGWFEAGSSHLPQYSGVRRTASWLAAANEQKSLASNATFPILTTGAIKGCFLVFGSGASSVVDSTGGNLFSAALFTSGDKNVIAGDTISVSYVVSTQTTVVDDGSFVTRRTAPGVLRWFDFDTQAQIGVDTITTNNQLPMSGGAWGYHNDVGRNSPRLDSSQKASGTNSMVMDFPSPAGASACGQWGTRITDNDARTFGAIGVATDQHLFIQVRIRVDDSMMNTIFFDQDNATPQSGGIKMFDIGASGGTGGTNTSSKIVVITHQQQRFPKLYQYGGSGADDLDGPNFEFENKMPDPFCKYGTPGQTFLVHPGCNHWKPNQWMTLQLGVDYGAIRNDAPWNGLYVDARVRLWMTYEGGATVLLHDFNTATDAGWNPIRCDDGPITKVWLFPYMTGKGGLQTYPTPVSMWYDELIIGTQKIPDPSTVIAPTFPAWRNALAPNTLADITSDGSTQSSAYVAAGYDIPGWSGDRGDIFYNYTAWGAGVLCPNLGNFGSMLIGSNGHEQSPTSSLSRFDLETAKWVAPTGRPQIHRQISPAYTAPSVDTEFWYNPDKVGVVDKTSYAYGGLLGLNAIDAEYLATGVPFNTAFADGASSFKGWPLTFGMRAQTNATMHMRYDQFCYIPPGFGGEALGSIVFAPMPDRWGYGPEALLGRCPKWVFTFGITSQDWLPHSTTVIDPAGDDANDGMAVFSEKYGKVIMFGRNDTPGTYDPITRTVGHMIVNQRYSARTISHAIGDAATGIVTEGHAAHLLITIGFDQLNQQFALWVLDLDLAATWNGVALPNFTDGQPASWAIMNVGAAGVDANYQRVALLSPALVYVNGNPPPSLAWSRARQQLIMWSPPLGLQQTNNVNGNVVRTPLSSSLVQTITIPTGFDGNANATSGTVPNWKTQPWVTTKPTISLAAGTPGVRTGSIGSMYKRFSWSEALDCAIVVGAPETMPVQALRIW